MADMTETPAHLRLPYISISRPQWTNENIFHLFSFVLLSGISPHIFGFKKENKTFCLPGSFLENKEEMIITGVQILFNDNNLKVNEINH